MNAQRSDKIIYGLEFEESQFYKLEVNFLPQRLLLKLIFFVDDFFQGPAESLMMTRRCSWTTYRASTVCEMTLFFHVSTPPQTWSWPPSCSLAAQPVFLRAVEGLMKMSTLPRRDQKRIPDLVVVPVKSDGELTVAWRFLERCACAPDFSWFSPSVAPWYWDPR